MLKKALYIIAIAVNVSASLACGGKHDHDPLTDCLESVGRRPCEDKSIKYNTKSKLCGCQTKNRGWIKWETKSAH